MAEASAPASSANLGPGFDCLALGLELRCAVQAEAAASWSVAHDGPCRPEEGSFDAVLAAARAAVDQPLALRVDNHIPIGMGLGSSAAAYATGAAAAWRAVGVDPDPQRVFRLVAELEGHPDNAAAAVFGGLVLVTAHGEALRLPWHPQLRVVVAVPSVPLATVESRKAVAATHPLPVIVRSLSRMGALVAGILTADASLLAAAGGDEIHESSRGGVRPEVADLMDAARSGGALHAAWSGAGPSVIALVDAARLDSVLDALAGRLGGSGSLLAPAPAAEGLR